MIIAVTGGTGRVGRAAVERLVNNGHTVRVLGRRAQLVIPGASYHQCDVTDMDGLLMAIKGCEGIVHLAAYPNPSLAPGQAIFDVNCRGTYNVFEACARLGVRRVVSASSINALGYCFGIKSFPIQYLPIDEDHPNFTTDPYSFSKQIVEEIADYYWRRDGISSVSLRLPGVRLPQTASARRGPRRHGERRQALREFLDLPEQGRVSRLTEMIKTYESLRSHRYWEKAMETREPLNAVTGMMAMRHNFWAWIDARDSAQAIEHGLLADYAGSHTLFVSSDHNSAGLPARELAEAFWPDVHDLRQPLEGNASLVSIKRAQTLLGFKPVFRFD